MWFTVYYNIFISNPGLKTNHSLVSGKPFCSDRLLFCEIVNVLQQRSEAKV